VRTASIIMPSAFIALMSYLVSFILAMQSLEKIGQVFWTPLLADDLEKLTRFQISFEKHLEICPYMNSI
jgi:hypothetical protein